MFIPGRRILLTFAITLAPTAAHALNYTVTNLGSLGGGGTRGLAINASGQVAGESYIPVNGPDHAFSTLGTAAIINPLTDDKGTLGGIASYGRAINDLGQVAGVSYADDTGNMHAFRTGPNAPMTAGSDIGSLGGPVTYAQGINNSGQVTGYSRLSNSNFDQHAYRTAPNAAINPLTDDLGTLGGTSSMAFAINASGQVVGSSTPTSGPAHAFRTAPGGVINAAADLGVLSPGFSSLAQGINANGNAVGQGNMGNNIVHAFYVPAGRGLLPSDDLGTLPGGPISGAFGINNSDVIVGASWINATSNTTHAVVWYGPGTPAVDLNALIPANSGWTLLQAQSINDNGQITGWGYLNGDTTQFYGFVLSPAAAAAPEPASLSMLALAGMILLRRKPARKTTDH